MSGRQDRVSGLRIALGVVLGIIALQAVYACPARAQTEDLAVLGRILSGECPAPPLPSSSGPAFRGAAVELAPETLENLWVSIVPGWSPSTGDLCAHASAWRELEGVRSEVPILSDAIDCVPVTVPEPPLRSLMLVGCLTAAALARLRR